MKNTTVAGDHRIRTTAKGTSTSFFLTGVRKTETSELNKFAYLQFHRIPPRPLPTPRIHAPSLGKASTWWQIRNCRNAKVTAFNLFPSGFHAESIKIARRIKVKRTDSNSLNYNQQVSRTPGKIKHKTGRAGQRQTFHERQLPPRSLGVWPRALHLSALIHTGTRISKRTERVREGTPSPCPAFRAYMWVSFAIVGWTINSYRQ